MRGETKHGNYCRQVFVTKYIRCVMGSMLSLDGGRKRLMNLDASCSSWETSGGCATVWVSSRVSDVLDLVRVRFSNDNQRGQYDCVISTLI